MKIIPDAKMVDIRVRKVPHVWKELISEKVIELSDDLDQIQLIHEPSGTIYSVKVDSSINDVGEIAQIKAKAKIEFIHHLHGQSWLLDDEN